MPGQWEPWLCAAQSLTSKNEQRTMFKSKPTMLSYDVQKSRSTAIQQNAGGFPSISVRQICHLKGTSMILRKAWPKAPVKQLAPAWMEHLVVGILV